MGRIQAGGGDKHGDRIGRCSAYRQGRPEGDFFLLAAQFAARIWKEHSRF
jgi:hypothetical protein